MRSSCVGFVVVTALMVKYLEAHCSNPKSPDSSTKTKRLPTAESPDGRSNDLLLPVGYPDEPAPLRALGSNVAGAVFQSVERGNHAYLKIIEAKIAYGGVQQP